MHKVRHHLETTYTHTEGEKSATQTQYAIIRSSKAWITVTMNQYKTIKTMQDNKVLKCTRAEILCGKEAALHARRTLIRHTPAWAQKLKLPTHKRNTQISLTNSRNKQRSSVPACASVPQHAGSRRQGSLLL